MLRTKRDMVVSFGPGTSRAKVPAGMPVSPCRVGTGEQLRYFVENFGSFLAPGSIERHDATYYGIVVGPDDVVEGSTKETGDQDEHLRRNQRLRAVRGAAA